MAAEHSRHVALTEPLMTFVDMQITQSRYATASEVIRAALRLMIEREEARAPASKRDDSTHG